MKEEVKVVEVEKLRKVLKRYQEDNWEVNNDTDKNKLGKILTIIDGALSDETQRKAVKDMVHEVWYRPVETIGRHYPQMHHVTEALGFSFWEKSAPPSETLPEEFNPYKELVK